MQEKYFQRNPDNLVELNSIDEIFKFLEDLSNDFLFRGVSDFTFKLNSSLERTNRDFHTEDWLINQFRRSIHEFLPIEEHPNNKFELLSLMQHHGVPTRLLDITKSPYIALYFACNNDYGSKQNIKDGAIYAFLHHNLQASSIQKIKERSKFDFDINWLNKMIKLNTEIFNEVFYKHKDDVALIVEPFKVNKRLYAQQGLFLISNFSHKSTEEIIESLIIKDTNENSNDPTIMKLKIKGDFKIEILKRLDRMNINPSTLFPGIDGFSKYLSEKNLYTDVFDKNEMHNY
jgi:hypothetical protein